MKFFPHLKAWRNHFLINLIGALESLWYAVLPPSWTGHDSATVNDLAHMTVARAIGIGLSDLPDNDALHNALSAMYSDHRVLIGDSSFSERMVIAEWIRYCQAADRHPVYRDLPWDGESIPEHLEWALASAEQTL